MTPGYGPVFNNTTQISIKSCGLHCIYAEHLKHCSDIIIPLLPMCFTSLFVHGVLPESMIYVALVPIVKNKIANICSKSNYISIAVVRVTTDLLL